ncbi:putative nuclear receptor corepressor 1, partial [Hyaloscypha finlandica]
MNVCTASPLLTAVLTVAYRSRYQPSYGDSGESRRSPRDQSPGRYNDRDEFRGGSGRGIERRRSSIPDARANNHNAFASNRETFREPIGRESSRDFPPREPPRGPKGLIDAPTGPRASNYGPDYRGDFGPYRGEYRGDRSRGRGRGWRDDSRDRGREPERDYRDRRDDRGPPQFRDDRGRDRIWGRENYRGRRQSPPPGRGRSPNYSTRDIRDPPPSIDLDRTRRGSRDGPLSGGSPSSENQSFTRGYGRARGGGRGGRGRGYYDEYHRPPGRSRSPDPSWGRRTQPSATPPPQVPAFGSSNVPIASAASPAAVASDHTSGPVPGVAVPTAPRAQLPKGEYHRSGTKFTSAKWVNPNLKASSQRPDPMKIEPPSFPSPTTAISPQSVPAQSPGTRRDIDEVKTDRKDSRQYSRSKTPDPSVPTSVNDRPPQEPTRKRKSVTGRRLEKPRKSPVFDGIPDDLSDSDSADDFEDGYFEQEISKLQEKVDQIRVDNPIQPREEPEAVFVKPIIESKVDDAPEEPAAPEPCIAPEVEEQPDPESSSTPTSLAPNAESKGKSHSNTPLEEIDAEPLTNGTTKEIVLITEALAAAQRNEASMDEQNGVPSQAEPNSGDFTSMQTKTTKTSATSTPRKPMMSDEFAAESDDDTSKSATNVKPRMMMIADELEPATKDRPRKPLMSDEFAATSDDESSQPATIVRPRKPMMSNEIAVASDDEPNQPPLSGRARKLMMSDEFAAASDRDMSEAENVEALESVRKQMRTPSLSSLPRFNCKKWDEDEEFLQTLKADPEVEARVKKDIQDTKERRAREQELARQDWKQRYLEYRQWTDFSDDPAAKASREKFEKSRARAAAEAAAPRPSAMPSAGAKPEPQRRTGSRFATEHDIERVLRESEQEAKETKEREERVARARTASAKEAKIPEMAWDEEEWEANEYIDKTHLVSFERSFAVLEYGEPIDNFTEEEARIFEESYLESPKQFSKIAEALPGRDYKACIQHYYLVKHPSSLKEKLKKQPKKRRGRKAGGPKPKSNALMADLGAGREEAEDGQDGENGERRRPRRAAAPVWPFETPASESEVASPAPTPGRKTAAAPKGDANGDAAPIKRKTKVPREKGTKQSKNNQLLAAAPVNPSNRHAESPTPPSAADWKNRRESGGPSRFPPQYDGAASSQPSFAPPYVPAERPNPSQTVNFDSVQQPFPSQERVGSAPPTNFDSPQDRRNIQQTSSYWSVPEQTDFPALLRHFGTDWHGIAKWMTSKTHIMVYRTVFQQWLVVPSDSNKSRCVANIQTQVKNYYQRQVDSGKMKEWEDIARDADDKKSRGEETGPLPQPTSLPKRRYDMPTGTAQRSGSAMEGVEDMASTS